LDDNVYQGRRSLQLTLQGVRPATAPTLVVEAKEPAQRFSVPVLKPSPRKGYLAELAQAGQVLLYGQGRPQLPGLDCDRPQSGKTYTDLVFWTLPPSPLHYHWLVSHTQPQRVHWLLQPVQYPTWDELLEILEQAIAKGQTLNLLALGQEHWLSPTSLLAGLHTLRHALHQAPLKDWGSSYAELASWYRGQIPMVTTKEKPLVGSRLF